jgi:hypothetical protein
VDKTLWLADALFTLAGYQTAAGLLVEFSVMLSDGTAWAVPFKKTDNLLRWLRQLIPVKCGSGYSEARRHFLHRNLRCL